MLNNLLFLADTTGGYTDYVSLDTIIDVAPVYFFLTLTIIIILLISLISVLVLLHKKNKIILELTKK